MPVKTPPRRHDVVLMGSELIAPDFMLGTMSCEGFARTAQPGQFFSIAVPGDSTELLRLPFTYVDADPWTGVVLFAYRVLGNGTRRLASLPRGTRTDLIGPNGNGWRIAPETKSALVIGGGTGVASVVPLTRELAKSGVAVDVIEGAQTARGIVLEREFMERGARNFHVTTDDGSRGTKGFPTNIMGGLLEANDYDAVYVCGPSPLMRGVAGMAREAGVPCQVSMENMMACGFGACATCACDTVDGKKGVCTDGPVFDAEEVVW